jgi:hypothetical protein
VFCGGQPWNGVPFINRSNTLHRLPEPLRPHQGAGRVTALGISNGDGTGLVSTNLAGCLCVWDLSPGRAVLRHQHIEATASTQPICEYLSVAVTHGGKRCVVGGCKRDRFRFRPRRWHLIPFSCSDPSAFCAVSIPAPESIPSQRDLSKCST